MMDMKKDQWVVLDLETTGLTPGNHRILECAAMLIDSKTLEIQDSVSWVVGCDSAFLPGMDLSVLAMHQNSGLLGAVLRAANERNPLSLKSHPMLDAALCNFFQTSEDIVIVGNSIGSLDIPFIRWHLPQFAKKLHYRTIDVRAGLRLYQEWVGPLPELRPQHRAYGDCMMSLAWLKFLKEKAFTPASITAREQAVDNPSAYRNFDGNGSPV